MEKEMKLDKESFETSSLRAFTFFEIKLQHGIRKMKSCRIATKLSDERGDVPGWVLVVLMTTGLVTAIWTIAAPRLTAILKNSLDAMNGIR
jgi:hypothetical protein